MQRGVQRGVHTNQSCVETKDKGRELGIIGLVYTVQKAL